MIDFIKKNYLNILYLIVFSLLLSFQPNLDNDVAWHVKVGEYIFNNGIPSQDIFSQHEGLNFMAHEWLFDLMLYIPYMFIGLIGTKIFGFLLTFLFMFSMFYLMNKHFKTKLNLVILGFLSIFLIGYFEVRPQIISLTLLAFFISNLKEFVFDNKNFNVLFYCFSMLIIANIHGGLLPQFVVIGLVFVFIRLLKDISLISPTSTLKEVFLPSIKGFMFIFSGIIVSIINPYGIKVYSYFVKNMLYSSDVTSNIAEWRSIFSSSGMENYVIFLIIIMPLLVHIFNNKKIGFFNFVIFLFFSMMPIFYIRLFPTYVVYVLMFFNEIYAESLVNIFKIINKELIVIKNMKYFKKIDFKLISGILKHMIPVFFIFFILFNFNSNYENKMNQLYPVKILEYIKSNNIDIVNNKIYNHYNIGGYLILNNYKVFIDGRTDVYLKEFNNNDNNKDIAREFFNHSYLKNIEKDGDIVNIYNKYKVKYVIDYKTSKLNVVYKNSNYFKHIYSADDYSLYEYLGN